MKVVIEKDGSNFYLTVRESNGDFDFIVLSDHDELLSVLIEKLGINYP